MRMVALRTDLTAQRLFQAGKHVGAGAAVERTPGAQAPPDRGDECRVAADTVLAGDKGSWGAPQATGHASSCCHCGIGAGWSLPDPLKLESDTTTRSGHREGCTGEQMEKYTPAS
jgi:hypothetical protein